MQDGSNPKQLIVEKMKESANILVTVSSNPSVDSLTAALGLTLMLNKLDKHATAVFSGVVPPAINFLEPSKTFENNVDSLRDFIIALDKEKADRLRYKVEDDVVRIFITPYRTKISEKDLQFSQGDFNVDLIIALGVEDQKDLDQAITAHGRILHDATVVTINAANQKSSLGSIDWQDGNASSLSEMLASIADQLKSGILDQQISTALLTGIVASTERFSNQRTTPHVMTIAAQLMAAGANQQLIATKLQTIPAPVSPRREKNKQGKGGQGQQQKKQQEQAAAPDGEMHIRHDEAPAPETAPQQPAAQAEKIEQIPTPAEPEIPIAPPAAQNFSDLKNAIKEETAKSKNRPSRTMVSEPPTPGSHNINAAETPSDQPKPKEDEAYLTDHPSWMGRDIQPPSMGGVLSATAEKALEDKIRTEAEEGRNRKILTHGEMQQEQAPQPEAVQPTPEPAKEQSQLPQNEQLPPPPEPAPEPETPEPPAQPPQLPELPPVPVAPAPEPEPQQSAPAEPEIPVAPPPLVVSEPLAPSMPPAAAPQAPQPEIVTAPLAPEATGTPPMANTPTIEELEREAANHAAVSSAPQTLQELENERKQSEPTPPVAPAPGQQSAEPVQSTPGALPPMPPMPDFSTLPPLQGQVPAPQQPPQLPELPPQPQQTMVPLTQEQPQLPPQSPQPPQPQTPPDPGQFQIPPQQ